MANKYSCSPWLRVGVLLVCIAVPGVAQQVATDNAPQPARPADHAADPRVIALGTRRVHVELRDVPLYEALRSVATQAGLKLTIVRDSAGALDVPRVTVRAADMPVVDAFRRILRGTDLAVVITPSGHASVVHRSQDRAQVTTGTVMGRVTDSASGRGVARATISVTGHDHMAITDAAGAFTLRDMPTGEHTIRVRLLGYRQATRVTTVRAGETATLNFVLATTATTLSGVVTTAMGSARRVEIGNDITVLKVDSIMKTAPITSVTDLLEGRVPGMTIQRTSGTPGDPARIRLRGTNSIDRNNDPIIIVNGVRKYSQQSDDRNVNVSGSTNGGAYNMPSPLDLIDPNTIETIEVLKGPSAAALYGSDAANGVIVITTKRGRPGVVMWNVNANAGISYLPGSWPEGTWKWTTPLLGGGPRLCVGGCGNAHIDSVVRFQALNDSRLTAFDKASTFGASTRVSGGTPQVTYSLTASTMSEDGILKLPAIEEERYLKFQGEPVPDWMRRPDQVTRYGTEGQLVLQIAPLVSLVGTSTLSNMTQHRTSLTRLGGGTTAIARLQGLYIDVSQLDERPILTNPYERVISRQVDQTNNVQLNLDRWVRRPINLNLGTSTLTSNNEISLARGLLTGTDAGGVWKGTTGVTSIISGGAQMTTPVLRVLSLVGRFDFKRTRTNDLSAKLRGLSEGVTEPSAGEDPLGNEIGRKTFEDKMVSWAVQGRFDLNSRLFAMPGFRLDQNGLAGENAKFNRLPQMSFSWLAVDPTRDHPMFGFVSSLRPRLSFGAAGVQPALEESIRLYQRIDGNPLSGSEPFYGQMLGLKYLGNTRLRPERGIEAEYGFDVELWGNRLTPNVTFHRKRQKDAILPNEYATSVDSGGNMKMNIGDIAHSGIELTVGVRVVQRQALSLSFNAYYAHQRSKVVRLNSEGAVSIDVPGPTVLDDIRYVVGYPMVGKWQLPILGYADSDGDGWISRSEVVFGTEARYIGPAEPVHQASFAPNMTFFNGRFLVNAMVSYTGGQVQSLGPSGAEGGRITFAPYEIDVTQGSDGFGRQASWIGMINNITYVGYMQKVNAIRLQSMSFGVNLPRSIARLLRARDGNLSLQGSNLGLWTNYVGVDPNVNGAYGGHGLVDTGQQPEPRMWKLDLKLTF